MGPPVPSTPLEITESISLQEVDTAAANPRESDRKSSASYPLCWNILMWHSKLWPLKPPLSIWCFPVSTFFSQLVFMIYDKGDKDGDHDDNPIKHWLCQILAQIPLYFYFNLQKGHHIFQSVANMAKYISYHVFTWFQSPERNCLPILVPYLMPLQNLQKILPCSCWKCI